MSWRNQIESNKGFVLLTEELLRFIPENEREEKKGGVKDICLSMWKLAAINGISNGNGKDKDLAKDIAKIKIKKIPKKDCAC